MYEKKYQVTLFDKSGKYKPVSCIVINKQVEDKDLSADVIAQKAIYKKGIEKICIQRNWSGRELKKYNYTKVKIRLYDKEAIAAKNKARYEAIKEAKYQSGEWKRPKEK